MKTRSKIFIINFSLLLILIMFNCKKEDSILIPTVSVSSVTDVTGTSASTGGEVIFDGGAEVTSRGICWGTTQNPTNVDSHLSCGSGMGSFSGSVSGLNPGTIYYLRTYAINAIGTDRKSTRLNSSHRL